MDYSTLKTNSLIEFLLKKNSIKQKKCAKSANVLKIDSNIVFQNNNIIIRYIHSICQKNFSLLSHLQRIYEYFFLTKSFENEFVKKIL